MMRMQRYHITSVGIDGEHKVMFDTEKFATAEALFEPMATMLEERNAAGRGHPSIRIVLGTEAVLEDWDIPSDTLGQRAATWREPYNYILAKVYDDGDFQPFYVSNNLEALQAMGKALVYLTIEDNEAVEPGEPYVVQLLILGREVLVSRNLDISGKDVEA